MQYLYGDSTASPLEVNYIDFLRDAIAFSTELLEGESRLTQLEQQSEARRRAAENASERVLELARHVGRVLESPLAAAAESHPGQFAAAIQASVQDEVEQQQASIEEELREDLAHLGEAVNEERSAIVAALEALILRHEIPDSSQRFEIVYAPVQQRYEARVIESALELEIMLQLEIPLGHLFAAEVRVDRVIDSQESLDKSGWFQKRFEVGPYKLNKLHVLRYFQRGSEDVISLRGSRQLDDAGFDLLVGPSDSHCVLVPVGKDGQSADPPFEAHLEDRAKLMVFHHAIYEAASALRGHRSALLDATLEGRPLRTHPRPSVLAERLIKHLAPVVCRIAEHSLSPHELVLKRLLSDDRREEIFVSKAELLQKIEHLTPAQRKLFAPLDLDKRHGADAAVEPAAVDPLEASARRVIDPSPFRSLPRTAAMLGRTTAAAGRPNTPPGPSIPHPLRHEAGGGTENGSRRSDDRPDQNLRRPPSSPHVGGGEPLGREEEFSPPASSPPLHEALAGGDRFPRPLYRPSSTPGGPSPTPVSVWDGQRQPRSEGERTEPEDDAGGDPDVDA